MTDLEKLAKQTVRKMASFHNSERVILKALETARAQGRIEGLQEAERECTTLAAAFHQEGIVEFERNGNMSNKKTRVLGDKASGAGRAANAIRAIIRKESE